MARIYGKRFDPSTWKPDPTIIRAGRFSIEEVMPYIITPQQIRDLKTFGYKRSDEFWDSLVHHDFNGHSVRMDKKRYQLFATLPLECAHCKMKGEYFCLERQGTDQSNDKFYLHLYGTHPEHGEMRLTMDHIHPLREGGTSSFRNLQILCSLCNHVKAHSFEY